MSVTNLIIGHLIVVDIVVNASTNQHSDTLILHAWLLEAVAILGCLKSDVEWTHVREILTLTAEWDRY